MKKYADCKFRIALYSITTLPRYADEALYAQRRISEHLENIGRTLDIHLGEYGALVNYCTDSKNIERLLLPFLYKSYSGINTLTKSLTKISEDNDLYIVSYNSIVTKHYLWNMHDNSEFIVGLSSKALVPLIFNVIIVYERVGDKNIIVGIDVLDDSAAIYKNKSSDDLCLRYIKDKDDNSLYVNYLYENIINSDIYDIEKIRKYELQRRRDE